jgi:activator of HSP90 ATPase
MNDRNELPRPARVTTRRQILIGAAAFGGVIAGSIDARPDTDDGISHAAESIHQEPVFNASRKQVYDALTDAKQFDKVVRLSAAMQSIAIGTQPTEVSPDVGGTFTLFGGYVTGRHLELVPNQRIVQAWRPQSWKAGDYSIVKFELIEQGSGTKIVLDHRGFPDGQGQHLAAGWKANYWEPLEKYLLTQK